MQTIIEDDNLKIGFEPGDASTNKTVVSFTGVGFAFGAIQREEFRRSLRSNGHVHDTYYVIDKDRKWYNTTGDRISAILGARLFNKRFFTVGNSMGGFGALLFSAILPGCEGAIAFCPQYSVNKKIIPAENRFDKWANEIVEWNYDACVNTSDASCKRIIFFGANDEMDSLHKLHFKRSLRGNSVIFSVEKCGHDVGQAIRDLSAKQGKNLIHEILDATIGSSGSSNEIRQILNSCGIDHSCWQPSDGPGG